MAEELELVEDERVTRSKASEGPPPNTGAILYAALAILLLAFFILLVSMATVNAEKRRVALASVSSAFGIFEGGAGIEGTSINKGGPSRERSHFESSMKVLQGYVKTKGIADQVIVQGSHKGFTISLSDALLFKKGGAELNPSAYTMLDIVKFIIVDGQKRFRVRIEGHTDDQPIKNERYPSNWELSVGRAIAVLRYVMRDPSIKPALLEAAGYAEFKPRFPNDSPEHRARNRRVDFTFLVNDRPRDVDPKDAIEIGGFRFSF